MTQSIADRLGEPSLALNGSFDSSELWTYRHHPFTVPAGVSTIHLRYDYSDRISADPIVGGGNVLDIGLFDERGTEAGSAGYRGWSGSDQTEFTVARDWATPPYKPGELGEGEWNVLLGAYKIHPERGLHYEVEIWFDPDLQPVERVLYRSGIPVKPNLPGPIMPGWYRGDLHCHTMASDGDSWLPDVLHAAVETGLDFLGVTDHNGAIPPERGVLAAEVDWPVLVPGVEVTTYAGHWNAWGGSGRWYDFREPTEAGMQQAMAAANEAGATVSINHPKPFGPEWRFPAANQSHAIEIWNGPWPRLNSVALNVWDDALRSGRRVTAIGGSDMHRLRDERASLISVAQLGTPTTWVHVEGELTAEAILAAIRRGDCFVSASPAGPQLITERRSSGVRFQTAGARGNALVALSENGMVETWSIPEERSVHELAWDTDDRYLRAQIVASDGSMLAVGNPVYRE